MIQIEKGEGLGDVYDILLSTCMYTDSDLTIKALNDSESARFSFPLTLRFFGRFWCIIFVPIFPAVTTEGGKVNLCRGTPGVCSNSKRSSTSTEVSRQSNPTSKVSWNKVT